MIKAKKKVSSGQLFGPLDCWRSRIYFFSCLFLSVRTRYSTASLTIHERSDPSIDGGGGRSVQAEGRGRRRTRCRETGKPIVSTVERRTAQRVPITRSSRTAAAAAAAAYQSYWPHNGVPEWTMTGEFFIRERAVASECGSLRILAADSSNSNSERERIKKKQIQADEAANPMGIDLFFFLYFEYYCCCQ